MVYVPGPFDSSHLYVQWGGKLPGGEQWSCGFRLRKKTAGVIDNGTGLLTGISGAVSTFHANSNSFISRDAKLSYVKVNAVGTDGKYIGQGTNQALYADVAGGLAVTQMYPNQIAWGVSLTTGFSRGPAHRGRFYLPLPCCSMDTDSRVLTAQADALKGAVQTMIDTVNGVNPDYEMAVFSRKLGSPGNRRITGVAIGKVLDTQRRRRRSLVEAYR